MLHAVTLAADRDPEARLALRVYALLLADAGRGEEAQAINELLGSLD